MSTALAESYDSYLRQQQVADQLIDRALCGDQAS
jgi:hypothetical protein